MLRRIADHPDISLHVYFFGAPPSGGGSFDPGFGTWVEWDVPLLEGYAHTFLREGARSAFVELAGALDRRHHDVLWVHGYARVLTWWALTLARKRGLHTMVRGESHLGLRHPPIGRLARALALPALFRRVDAFLAIGSLNEAFYRRYGVPSERIFRMPYAVDNDFFDKGKRDPNRLERIRKEAGIEAGVPVILFAGKLQSLKRPGDLITAYEIMSRSSKRPQIPYLLIVGDGPERDKLAAQVRDLGLDRVRFLGFRNQSELPYLYELCDVFVLPSEWERWGLAVNEAMAAGCAVIVSDAVAAGVDLVDDGRTGRVVPVGRPDKLAGALDEITSDPSLSRAMGRAARDRIGDWSFDEDIKGLEAALTSFSDRR